MNKNKDSAEVIEFMALYAQVKKYCDDTPENLIADFRHDKSVNELCNKLWGAAFNLRTHERQLPALFTAPVNPEFIKAWRDFEARYDQVLNYISFVDLLPEVDIGDFKPRPTSKFNLDSADDEASEQAEAIEAVINFARDQSKAMLEYLPEDLSKTIDEGINAWESLTIEAGLDLRGVFRRRALVPFVLVPPHVSDEHGIYDKISIYKNLQQAHDAFIFGAPLAALALMRSIMEAMLRDHYGAVGVDLEKKIDSVQYHLPKHANAAALHRLRKLANAILHLDVKKGGMLPDMKPFQLEKEIVLLLFVLRALVEGVPHRRPR